MGPVRSLYTSREWLYWYTPNNSQANDNLIVFFANQSSFFFLCLNLWFGFQSIPIKTLTVFYFLTQLSSRILTRQKNYSVLRAWLSFQSFKKFLFLAEKLQKDYNRRKGNSAFLRWVVLVLVFKHFSLSILPLELFLAFKANSN